MLILAYIVNHSQSYTIAALASWTEFWLECAIFGGRKFYPFITTVGILLTAGGQITRSFAMWYCGENFSHIIMDEKDEKHKLVKDGIYKYLRHPSYTGWFYWSAGTQLILCNPICTVGYILAAWFFFRDRIKYEEYLLLKFYGREYQSYIDSTVIAIPFLDRSKPTARSTVAGSSAAPSAPLWEGVQTQQHHFQQMTENQSLIDERDR